MPIYEFACQACATRFETLVMGDKDDVRCPACRSDKLEKLISAHHVGRSSPDLPPCETPACGAGACNACQP